MRDDQTNTVGPSKAPGIVMGAFLLRCKFKIISQRAQISLHYLEMLAS